MNGHDSSLAPGSMMYDIARHFLIFYTYYKSRTGSGRSLTGGAFMSNKAARNLFIFGSLFFLVVFLAFTFDTMGKLDKRTPEITEEVNEGKMVWHSLQSYLCHAIFGTGSYFART